MVLIPRWWDEGRGGFRERQREVSKRDISLFCYSRTPPPLFFSRRCGIVFGESREERDPSDAPPGGRNSGGVPIRSPSFPFPLLSEIDEAKDCSFAHHGIKGETIEARKEEEEGFNRIFRLPIFSIIVAAGKMCQKLRFLFKIFFLKKEKLPSLIKN